MARICHRPLCAGAVALVAIAPSRAPQAIAAAPATKTVTVVVLDDNVSDPNPAAATWGRVTSSPVGIDCPGDCTEDFPAGSTVALTLVRKPGFVLSEWDVFRNARGPGCVAASVCTLTLDGELGPVQVAAALRSEAQLLAFPKVPAGCGSARPRRAAPPPSAGSRSRCSATCRTPARRAIPTASG